MPRRPPADGPPDAASRHRTRTVVVVAALVAVVVTAVGSHRPSTAAALLLLGAPALLLAHRTHTRRPTLDPRPWRRLVAGVVLLVVSSPALVHGVRPPSAGGTGLLTAVPVLSVVAVLVAYPLVFAGSLDLLHYRRSLVLPGVEAWFDGLASLLAIGAVLAAVPVPALVAAGSSPWAAWSASARPCVVLVLAAFAVANCQLVGWRTDRRLVKVVAVFTLLLTAEVLDLVVGTGAAAGAAVTTTGVAGGSRAAALVLLGAAAWRPAPRPSATVELNWATTAAPLSVFTMTMVAGFLATSHPGAARVTVTLTTAALTVVALKIVVLVRTLVVLLESRRLSLVDDLTGLPNRRAFFEAVDRVGDEDVAVMLLDLNGFKHVNDTFGHLLGDKLLQDTAGRLRDVVPERGVVARLGGDEFVVLLPGPDASAVERVADAVQRVLGPREVDGRWLATSVSIGVAHAGTADRRTEDVLHAADVAMYQAKGSGGGWRTASRAVDRELT